MDSIVDTVGTVLALHLLGVERVYASALPFGEVSKWVVVVMVGGVGGWCRCWRWVRYVCVCV